jgi:hypothetical protein
MGRSLLSLRDVQHTRKHVGAGDALKAIARFVNYMIGHLAQNIFPWVGNAALFLGLAGIGPKRRIERDALSNRFIRSGLAQQLLAVTLQGLDINRTGFERPEAPVASLT